MNEPITVSITNLLNQARNLQWLNKGHRWIEAGQTIEVDYEPWSCADRKQRECIIAELSNKYVSFTMHVLVSVGEVKDIAYDPSAIMGNTVSVAADAPKAEPVAEVKTAEIKQDERSHIIVAGSQHTDDLGLGLRAEIVSAPGSATINPSTGFAKEIVGDGNHAVIAEGSVESMFNDAPAVEETPEALSVEEVPEAPVAEEAPAEDNTREQFNALVAAKKWNEALQVLIDKFGADKVTITTKNIMAVKDYDAIVAKYKLA